ncbi:MULTISPECIES: flavin reductase family protein [Pandoraea]|uniref:flavin reductase family protein n=1 Tax=Pandoraea TaxID=93217 RepID=UPI001F5CFE23|nr:MULTISPECIES: flavin reductase family protein [Pandoraea]MCI3206034.1 flavin reductase [Pandoraea sp. LA3]MDN4584062.1 flavin reductase [Pandoraea capi]
MITEISNLSALSALTESEFRRAMSSFATGVTIVAANDGDDVHAMTASAFMSGSLSPPLIVICIGRKSRLHDVLGRTDRFGVSVLRDDQQSVSGHFSRQASVQDPPTFVQIHGAPLLETALAVVSASMEARFECGDHTLFVGRVLHAASEPAQQAPLIHYAGKYRHLENPGLLSA